MVYLPLTPTTYPHTLTNSIVINIDASLKGSTLSQVRETLSPGTGGHTGYAGGHKGPHTAPHHPRPYGIVQASDFLCKRHFLCKAHCIIEATSFGNPYTSY